jgi:LPPG:FO 2-phospho-L-lactate transferase
MIVALAGGVGGAKLAVGLYRALAPGELTLIVNTGDDAEMFGLRISPDLDTALYTLAGLVNQQTGWGLAGDTFAAMGMLERYGAPTWFRLGDRDLATHMVRTGMLREGRRLTEVTAHLAARLGVQATLLPMCDEPVATLIETPDGLLDFQEYFVHRRWDVPVSGIRLRGIETARPTREVRAALLAAEVVVVCPSNPVVSIGPILGVPGLADLLRALRVPRVAVSPIVGGQAVSGPAGRLMRAIGYEESVHGVAAFYRGLIDGLVIDYADAAERARLEADGLAVLVTGTIMHSADHRLALAREVLAFARTLAESRR